MIKLRDSRMIEDSSFTVNIVLPVGNHIEEIPCTTVTDHMDKLCWGSAIGCFHSNHTAQKGSLEHFIQQ